MKVLIPLIKGGSKEKDLELRFALRSIEKHLKGFDGVIIAGHLPPFIQNVTHIPYRDGPKKQENIRGKILAAFEITDTICFSNDDIYLSQDFASVSDFPTYYGGFLDQVAEKGAKPLKAQLEALNKPIKHFDIHTPIVYQKDKFKESLVFTPETIIKSAYGNYHELEGVYLKDLKINTHLKYDRIKEEIKDRPCFSIGTHGLTSPMLKVLNELYPNPSKYEK